MAGRLPLRALAERLGYRAYYRLVDLAYAVGVATRKRTVAGSYWSYEPTNPHGDDPGLAALDELPSDATVFDVGAHVGEYAVPLAVDTDRSVVAFEPNPVSAERLARNARRNGVEGRVSLRRTGVGAETATREFYRSTFSKCSSLDRNAATRWGARVAAVESVPVRRIDDVVREAPLPSPDGIKVDVEGHELAVLRGATRTIEASRPLLVVEVHGVGDRDAGDPETLHHWFETREYDVRERDGVWVCRP